MSETTTSQAPSTEPVHESADTPVPPPTGATGSGADSASDASPPAEGEAATPEKKDGLASPRIAAAVRAETRARQALRAAEREREALTAEARQTREQLARERQAHERTIGLMQLAERDPIAYLQQIGYDGRALAEHIAQAGDPQYQTSREVAALRKELAELRTEREQRQKQEQEQAARQQHEALVENVTAAVRVPEYESLSRMPERAVRSAVARALQSGNFRTVEQLGAHLDREAREFIQSLSPAQQASAGVKDAQAQGQNGDGSGTHAAKPQGSKGLTSNLSASSNGASPPLTREQRAAQLKAELARQASRGSSS